MERQEYSDAIRQGAESMRKLNLMSDTFVSVALEDIAACQHVVRTILGRDDIEIISTKGQYRLLNLTSKDSILDVFAQDRTGRKINIEIQRKTTQDHARRTRYYGSVIDKSVLDKGANYEDLPDVYIIYISEADLWHVGETVYEVEKTIGKDRKPYDDGKHVVFVNSSVDDGSAIAEMMRYFISADPDDMSQGDLSKRVQYLKCEKGGYEEMCEVAEKIYNQGIGQGVEQGIKEMALRLHRSGMSDDLIAEAANVSVYKVKEWIVSEND